MKRIRQILLFLLLVIGIAIAFNYKKLNIIAGYSAKSMASSVFLADRDFHFSDTTDTNFPPVNIADNTMNSEEKSITASVFGLLKRKAVYREGLGSVLVIDENSTTNIPTPKRTKVHDSIYFPYGNKMHKDTIFSAIDYSILNKAIDSIFQPKYKTRATVVVYKDKIIAERYADGFNENSLLLGWSMTKSVLGTLYGVMQHQGKLHVNDKAPVKAWQNDERKDITLNNLLQMNSGLAWNEDYKSISDVTKMLYLEEDMSKSQIDKPLEGKPNESWKYSSGISNLLSGIVRDKFATHQEYLDYWYTNLIDKIGMNSMVVETDLVGNYIASSYSWATARDWSKLGLLYLFNGNWNGEQIFGTDWVAYATAPTPTSNGEYGATIWLNNEGQLPDVPKNMYHFRGYQGQYVIVLPEQDMVIVRMGLVKDPVAINKYISSVISAIKN